MISNNQIEDWIHEIEERPSSAALILRSIAARLSELDRWNEELLADNIQLRSGNRVEEYESRIAALEYQLELLKRGGVSLSGEGAALPEAPAAGCLILFSPAGQVLRLPLPADLPAGGITLGRLPAAVDRSQPPGFLAARNNEELLFVFDSGRSVTLPAGQIPAAGAELDFRQGQRIQPRPGEELAAVLPINALALAEYCVQVSRRACAKLMPKSGFQSLIARGSVGAGIKRRPDRTAVLALCGREDALVLATREGCLAVLPVSRLPYSVDEILQLSISDFVITGFAYGGQADLLFVTNVGKLIRREASWLEPPGSFKSRGQAVFSVARREAGVRLVGAAAVPRRGQCAALRSDGSVWAYPLQALLDASAIDCGPEPGELAAFTLLAGAA